MTFTNPVYGDNFADPQVVAVDGTYTLPRQGLGTRGRDTRTRPFRHVLHVV